MLPSQPQFCGITCLQQLGTELQKAARAGYEAGMSNVSQTGPSVRCRCCWWRNLAEANFEAPLSTASSDPQTGFIELCYNIPARSEAKVTALSLGTGHNDETGGDLSPHLDGCSGHHLLWTDMALRLPVMSCWLNVPQVLHRLPGKAYESS